VDASNVRKLLPCVSIAASRIGHNDSLRSDRTLSSIAIPILSKSSKRCKNPHRAKTHGNVLDTYRMQRLHLTLVRCQSWNGGPQIGWITRDGPTC
jgi:hypothetical protein